MTRKSPQQRHAGELTLSNLNIKTNHQDRCKQVQQSIHSSWVSKIPVITSTSWHRPANHLGVIVLMFTVHHMLGFATCHLLGEVDQFPWKPISTTQSIIVNNIDGSGSLHTPLEYILMTLPMTIREIYKVKEPFRRQRKRKCSLQTSDKVHTDTASNGSKGDPGLNLGGDKVMWSLMSSDVGLTY